MAAPRKTKSLGDIVKAVESSVQLNETSSDTARLSEMASTLKNLKSVPLADVSKEISELKMFCTNTLDSLSNSIVAKLSMLEQIDKSIMFQQENLDRVHKITIEATTLESLLLAQEAQRKVFNDEMDLVKKTWLRDQEAYNYQQTLAKRKDADDFDVFKKRRVNDLEEIYKNKMQEVVEKESVLAKMKADYEAAIIRGENFQHELNEKLEEQAKKITAELTKQFNFDLRIAQKDAENASRLSIQTVSSQNSRIAELEKQLADSRNQENTAISRLQQIAEKSIENAGKATPIVFSGSSNDSNNFNEIKRGK
jgi:hypothetical protein